MATVETKERNMPAYTSFTTFKNFVGSFKSDGLPARIDKSTMGQLSGGSQSHLTSSLRFLGLIGQRGEPLPLLEQLVESHDDIGWSTFLDQVVAGAYQHVVGELDIKKASAGQLTEAFRKTGLEGPTLDKALRFYLAAIKDAGIEHSPQIAALKPKNAPKRTKAAKFASVTNGVSGKQVEDGHAEITPPAPKGMIEFPIYVKGKHTGRIIVDATITADECKMISLAVQMVEAYAEQASVG